jgi:SAM-dependent methyltransferase
MTPARPAANEIAAAPGWEASAPAWIAAMGPCGDFAREYILDPPLAARIGQGGFRRALDVGCGEGRCCRILRGMGVLPVGIDPSPSLIARARVLDPQGEYSIGRAEALPFEDAAFDLVLCYMTLINVDDLAASVAEMARVLMPRGSLLVANLHGAVTAGSLTTPDAPVTARFAQSSYFDIAAKRVRWSGIDIINWHRPLSTYMQAFLDARLMLRAFDEPRPADRERPEGAPFAAMPHFVTMEWQK